MVSLYTKQQYHFYPLIFIHMSPTKKTNHDEKEEVVKISEHHETTAEAIEEISEKAEKIMTSSAAKIENVMDEYADKVSKSVEGRLDPAMSKKAKEVA